jgi:hypothetical protein
MVFCHSQRNFPVERGRFRGRKTLDLRIWTKLYTRRIKISINRRWRHDRSFGWRNKLVLALSNIICKQDYKNHCTKSNVNPKNTPKTTSNWANTENVRIGLVFPVLAQWKFLYCIDRFDHIKANKTKLINKCKYFMVLVIKSTYVKWSNIFINAHCAFDKLRSLRLVHLCHCSILQINKYANERISFAQIWGLTTLLFARLKCPRFTCCNPSIARNKINYI